MVNALSPPSTEHADRLRSRTDTALEGYVAFREGCPARLQEAIRYSLLAQGKRFRPTLVLLAAEACGGPIEQAMPAACAVEMVHAYSLIHDDLPAMDDDDLRRGRPTCHRVFGEARAILAGDALLALAFETLATGIRPPHVAAACCATLATASGPCQLVGGQADDLAGLEPGREDAIRLESIHSRKTGAMIRAALRLGGLTAAASAERLTALDEFGRRLGLAFQITDDLLDVCSNEAAAGKRVGKDVDKGKLTFPGVLGVDRSAAYAEQLVHEACESLRPFGPEADRLRKLARSVLERNR
jgi:geranylgeranyl diphosphate synthase, type II